MTHSRRRAWLQGLVAGAVLVPWRTGLAQDHEPVPGEEATFARFRPPCCYQQTLDVHASPEAQALRGEIRGWLRERRSVEAIEHELVARFGPRILAVPPGVPLERLVPLVGGLSLVSLVVALRSTLGRGPVLHPAPDVVDVDPGFDARLEQELQSIEE